MQDFVYFPPEPEKTNILKFGRKYGLESVEAIYDRADADPEWFWRAVIDDSGIKFSKDFQKLTDQSNGIPWTRWFIGGKINITYNCVEKFADSDAIAVKYESEDGSKTTISFRELDRLTGKLAGFLLGIGIHKGDRVGLYMPPSSEGVIAFYAILRAGAVAVPIFSGYGRSAVKSRMEDAGAKAIFSFSWYWRKGKKVDMNSVTADLPGIARIMKDPVSHDDVDFYDAIENGAYIASADTDAEDPAIMLYTSGTTGKPKGTVHVHGGSLVNIVKEVRYYMDMKPTDTLFWVSDLGWMMGPWAIIGANASGGAIFVYDGAVDYPDPFRLWDLAKAHNITLLGLSPTLVRGLKSRKAERVMEGVRVFGSTGEPWDHESWMWLFQKLGNSKVPISNISGGTDIIGCFLASTPAIPLMPRCLYRGLGMKSSVLDDGGKPVEDKVGYLVSLKHCPSMTRGIWNQEEKYIETYWSKFPDRWFQGDWAMMDSKGYYFLFGRADDVMKIAGKRLGPNEVENVVLDSGGVTESAVVGVPDEMKGEAVAVFYTGEDTDAVRTRIRNNIVENLGKSFSPKFVIWLPQLPKTRNGKIMRRVVRSSFLNQDTGDLSNIEETAIVDYIREIGKIRDKPEYL